ncbi:MAG TPA: glycosyltransferase family 2 protein [Pyrinomonadaceae bacterium]|nr:glycosyltransferase family 2 protein [Pyrinomonadaceae bacterium]
MLNQITPLILTYNEAANIGRTLARLAWAREVVVVDSFSDDETIEVASSFANVRVVQRAFDSHRNQWEFGLRETGITTAWILALDADYVLTRDAVAELKTLNPIAETAAFRATFVYCINGKELHSGIYPPVTVLYRRDAASYIQDGHAQRVVVDGRVEHLRAPLLHDDRKPLRRWLNSQARYAELEAAKLLTTGREALDFTDRLRLCFVVVPAAMFFYCLIVRGGIFDGWRGFYYAFQRSLAELMLSLYLIDARCTFSESTRITAMLRRQSSKTAD